MSKSVAASEVVILFGANGTENLVSCASAQHFSEMLPDADCIFWQEDGSVLEVDRAELHGHQNVFLTKFTPKKVMRTWATVPDYLDHIKTSAKTVLLSVHGGDGENGWVQRQLEDRKIFFTGSGSACSAVAIDKTLSKNCVKPRGVKLADQIAFKIGDSNAEQNLIAFQKQFGSIVLKPANEGSSTNLSFIHGASEVSAWWKVNESSSISWIAEEMLRGREFTIGVMMHRGCLMVLPPSEVILEHNANFDYKGKYLGVGNQEITPADLSPKLTAQVQEVVLVAHAALGCYGYTRSEVIMTERGVFYLETNTLPGFTKKSFIPQQLQAAQIPVADFISEQLRLARCRYL